MSLALLYSYISVSETQTLGSKHVRVFHVFYVCSRFALLPAAVIKRSGLVFWYLKTKHGIIHVALYRSDAGAVLKAGSSSFAAKIYLVCASGEIPKYLHTGSPLKSSYVGYKRTSKRPSRHENKSTTKRLLCVFCRSHETVTSTHQRHPASRIPRIRTPMLLVTGPRCMFRGRNYKTEKKCLLQE